MPTKKQTPPPASRPRAVLEWAAAILGLVLTLSVVGYSLWEALTTDRSHPALSVSVREIVPAAGGYVVKIRVRNENFASAAGVDVTGKIESPGGSTEERTTNFAYVPGRGSAEGGLVFKADPRAGALTLNVEGYSDP